MEVACANIRLVLKKEVIMWLNNGRTEVVKQLKKSKKAKKEPCPDQENLPTLIAME